MFLFLVSLAVIPILPGMLFVKIFYRRNHRPHPGMLHAYTSGLLLCLVFCGVINALSVLLNKTLSECVIWYCLGLLWLQLIAGIALVFLWNPRETNLGELFQKIKISVTDCLKGIPERCRKNPLAMAVLGAVGLLIVIQIIGVYRNGYVYMAGDMTLETVQSFLEHDSLYRVHPLTGQPYEVGVPLRIQILCLPTLYASICSAFGLAPKAVVWTLMPIYFLLCSYLVYYLLGDRLFGKKVLYKSCFLLLVVLLNGWGTYAYGMDGLGLLYQGFRGESVRAGILLPYVLCQVLDHKWWSVLLCIGTELFLVWTLYGMGACVFVAVGFLIIALVRKDFADKSGKEASVCGK